MAGRREWISRACRRLRAGRDCIEWRRLAGKREMEIDRQRQTDRQTERERERESERGREERERERRARARASEKETVYQERYSIR